MNPAENLGHHTHRMAFGIIQNVAMQFRPPPAPTIKKGVAGSRTLLQPEVPRVNHLVPAGGGEFH
jgi:hypothetical protein